MKYPAHGSIGYRLLSTFVWQPYHWAKYRPEPDLRPFMIRRRVWGGKRITPERMAECAALRKELAECFEDERG
jgi:hypothetical protein